MKTLALHLAIKPGSSRCCQGDETRRCSWPNLKPDEGKERRLPVPHAALATRLGRFVAASAKFSLGTAEKGKWRTGLPSLAWNTNLSFIFGKAKKVRKKTAENLCARIFNATFNALQSGRRCRGDYDNSSLNSCLLSLSLSCRPS